MSTPGTPGRRRRRRRDDQLDVSLVDANLLEEIELLTGLMEAASGVERRLSPDDIDRALGVSVPRQRPASD